MAAIISSWRRKPTARSAWSRSALGEPHKREEIARMLAGAEITEEARKAAERLMAGATR